MSSSAVAGAHVPEPPLDNPRDASWTVGARVPHRWLDASRSASTLDLASAGFALIVPAGHEGYGKAVEEMESRTGLSIALHVVEAGSAVDAPAAVLVRPDGVIAWRSSDAHAGADALPEVLASLLSSTAPVTASG